MFNVIKVDLRSTDLKPFVYPPDATAEYTIEDEYSNSKWRFPKEVAEAVSSGCSMGLITGYDMGKDESRRSSIKAWYAAYALLLIDEEGVAKLKEIVRRNLVAYGEDVEAIEQMAKNEGPKVNRQIPEEK